MTLTESEGADILEKVWKSWESDEFNRYVVPNRSFVEACMLNTIRLTEEKMNEKIEDEVYKRIKERINIDDAQSHAKGEVGYRDKLSSGSIPLRLKAGATPDKSSHDGIEEKGKAGKLLPVSADEKSSSAPKHPDSESENIDKLKERIAELEYDLLAYRRPTNVRVIDVRKDEKRKVLEEVKNKIKTYSPTVEYHNNCMIREQLLSLISELEEKR